MATPEPSHPRKRVVSAEINGTFTEFLCEPRQTLLEVLRDTLGLTGTKEGCGNGNCGACTVLIDGRAVNACLIFAPEIEGCSIITVEGLAREGRLDPLQQAFLEQGALQCGVCTPGFLVAARGLLDANPRPTEEEVRLGLAGNLCRCTGYDKIVRAVLEAASGRAEEASA